MTATAAKPTTRHDEPLFEPYRLGSLMLANRFVMAPMTRSRALDGNVPNPLAETYYRQRAGAGLIVTEATQVSPQGVGYIRTPGIHSPSRSQHGERSLTRCIGKTAKSSYSFGMSAVSRIQISMAARFPSRPPRSQPMAKYSPRKARRRW